MAHAVRTMARKPKGVGKTMRKAKIALVCAIAYAVALLTGCSAGQGAPPETDAPSVDYGTLDAEENSPPDESAESAESVETEALYLGVENYGAEETNKSNRDNFRYRFEIDGAETCFRLMNGVKDAEGNYDYPLQNALKEGYPYRVTIEGDTVTDVSEILPASQLKYEPIVEGEPGVKTLKNFLKTAMEPVGTTLYIYGGGWDWQDEGSAVQATSLGVSPDWVRFFHAQDENYTYKAPDGDPEKENPATSYYPYGGYNEYYYAGLDCTGYLGWVIYNTMQSVDGEEGYVGPGMVWKMSERGWGDWTQDVQIPDGNNGYEMKPGDVMAIHGHVWISLGTCDDGSVVIAHSSPSKSRTGQPGAGVQISAIGYDKDCEAYQLADKYMSEHYPEWYERYPIYLCNPEVYFAIDGEKTGKFSWDVESSQACLTDTESMQNMSPAETLAELFDD